MSRQYIASLIERVINNESCLQEWDDLVSLKHADPLTQAWASRLSALESRFSDKSNGRMLSDEGVDCLREILDELRAESRA